MDKGHFLAKLGQIGDFRCNLDRRRLRSSPKPHHTQQGHAAWLLWFGHCHNGKHHHCEFLIADPQPRLLYCYLKTAVRDGITVRLKGKRPVNTKGRGRRPKFNLGAWARAKAQNRSK